MPSGNPPSYSAMKSNTNARVNQQEDRVGIDAKKKPSYRLTKVVGMSLY